MRAVADDGVIVLARIKKIVKEDNRLMAFTEMHKVSPMLSTLTRQADDITKEQKELRLKVPEPGRTAGASASIADAGRCTERAIGSRRRYDLQSRIHQTSASAHGYNSYRFAIGMPLNAELDRHR